MVNKDTKTTVVETEYVQMFIEDGIFYMYYHPLDSMDLDVAKAIVNARLTFKNGISYPSLFDIREVRHTTKEARDYMANEGNDLVTASGIVVSSPLMKMLINFYINVNKPKNPTRMFMNKESALVWLNKYKEK